MCERAIIPAPTTINLFKIFLQTDKPPQYDSIFIINNSNRKLMGHFLVIKILLIPPALKKHDVNSIIADKKSTGIIKSFLKKDPFKRS